MTPDQAKAGHRLRIELILLGMVLAKTGDRQYILDNVQWQDLSGELIVDALQGIRDKEPAPVRRMFNQWGVAVNGKVSHAIVARIGELAADERARDVLRKALATGTNDLKNALIDAYRELKPEEKTE